MPTTISAEVKTMRTLIALVGVSLMSGPVLASVPPNDSVGNAIQIDAVPFVHAEDTRDATTAETDPSCAGQGATVWYSFVPEQDGRIEVNTFGSNYDTTLSAYIEDAAGIRAIACNDDAAEGVQSQLRFTVAAGVTYLFMVGSFAEGRGDLVFTALTPPAPPPLRIESEAGLRQPGLVTLEGSITCSHPSTVHVFGEVVQLEKNGPKDRRQPTWARFASNGFPCDGETPWTTHPVPLFGVFERGPAAVLATVTVCGDDSLCESVLVAIQIRIERARKAERYSADEQGRGPESRVRPRKKN